MPSLHIEILEVIREAVSPLLPPRAATEAKLDTNMSSYLFVDFYK